MNLEALETAALAQDEMDRQRAQLDKANHDVRVWRECSETLEQRLQEARSVLRTVEWNGRDNRNECGICGNLNSSISGHAPDCQLKKCLGE